MARLPEGRWSLGNLEKAVREPRKSGQPQSEDSVERGRQFADRMTVIEKLKRKRLENAVPEPPKPKKKSKPPTE